MSPDQIMVGRHEKWTERLALRTNKGAPQKLLYNERQNQKHALGAQELHLDGKKKAKKKQALNEHTHTRKAPFPTDIMRTAGAERALALRKSNACVTQKGRTGRLHEPLLRRESPHPEEELGPCEEARRGVVAV